MYHLYNSLYFDFYPWFFKAILLFEFLSVYADYPFLMDCFFFKTGGLREKGGARVNSFMILVESVF